MPEEKLYRSLRTIPYQGKMVPPDTESLTFSAGEAALRIREKHIEPMVTATKKQNAKSATKPETKNAG